ncbi:Intermediate filament protein [Scheffersomyces spartinae]|uniref:Intermediate filament protein n=1 Tax=Scheffersomyces spartinae TaxID=45513 RepID=A0A9P7VB42_9ASCO|nr:Intermediate filament protein [Scheffersomyces spartinae]KAG7194124.1 Intermediate filament protein [Scheffersomyces spartinae]
MVKDNNIVVGWKEPYKRKWLVIAILIALALLKYGALYWVVFWIGVSTLPLAIYGIASNRRHLRPISIDRPQRRFQFLESDHWIKAKAKLMVNTNKLDDPITSDSFLISELLNDFIDLIINEFINSWFVKISPSNNLFQNALKLELQNVTRTIHNRLLTINYPQLLVTKILPLLQDHFEAFNKARDAIVHIASQNKIPTDSLEYDIEIAKAFKRGGIHYGVTIGKGHGTEPKSNEIHYLRNKVASILPYLLSEPESENDIVLALVREIMACTILVNVFGMLSEGDFYNLLIVKFIGDNLKRQDQVKQLRAALEEHTLKLTFVSPSTHEIRLKIALLDNSSHVSAFKQIISEVTKLTSLQELKDIRGYITVEFFSSVSSSHNEKLLRRMKKVRNVLDERIRALNKNKTIDNSIDELTIYDIFDNSVVYKQFVAFMNYNGRIKYLNLYNDIEKLKAPLEELSMVEEDDYDEEDEVDEEFEETERLSLSLGFSSMDDIRRIRRVYFNDDDHIIDESLKQAIDQLILKDGTNDFKLYMRVRKSLFRLQNDILKSLVEDDLPAFKQSEFFQKVVDLKVFHFQEPSIENTADVDTLDTIKNYTYKEDNNKDQADGEISQTVIKAVEDAFTQIMNSDTMQSTTAVLKDSKRELLGSTIPSSLFGDDTHVIGGSSRNSNRNSRLFDDELSENENESGTDTESISLDSSEPSLLSGGGGGGGGEQLQLFLAGPGNLSLSEEIVKLNEDLHKLTEQLSILAPLIRKAELTNNVNELRILMKSKTSLEREINAKELQRQQYIVQENDNSLYGKSKVSIQSYIIANEHDKDYVLYIVEVQKYSAENPNVTTAGWIVARRYSQFYKLNEYLKFNYPKVGGLKFPKKAVLVLKFQQRQIVELRKQLLEEYLQDLIRIPEICSDKAFRAFLSSENFDLKSSLLFGKSIQSLSNKVYSGLSTRLNPEPYRNPNTAVSTSASTSSVSATVATATELTENMKEMQRELRQYDDSSSSSSNNEDSKTTTVFVRLICDFLISIFRLKSSKTWLRGRALVVILQQLFGTTIEKKVYQFVDLQVRSESKLIDLLVMTKNMLFPNGHFKDPPVVRSYYEMSTTKQEARVIFGEFMKEACGRIFGVVNTNYAATHLFDMVQVDFLNEHLMFEVFDLLVAEVFPETGTITTQTPPRTSHS